MSVLAQYAPYALKGRDWASCRRDFADAVEKALSRHAPDLPSLVLQRRVIAPTDMEAAYGLSGGHLFHGEHALDQLFAMRPLLGCARYRAPLHGLYLCGAGTHPAGGVTGSPGPNAAREFLEDLRR